MISNLGKSIDADIRLLLISKGSVDVSGKLQGEILARAKNHFVNDGYEIWTLTRNTSDHLRKLTCDGLPIKLKIVENGLELVD